MLRHRFPVALAMVSIVLLTPSMGGQGSVHALFSLDSPTDGPFPSDWFTVRDNSNLTHRRVSLPPPADCEVSVSDCDDITVINELDGFNVQPRLSIPFSGPIDPNTVTSDTVFLVSLGTAGFDQDYMPWGHVVGIDQVVWDPVTNSLHVESDALLAQHTRFALIVTRGVHDEGGSPVEASDTFRHFRATVPEDYKQALLDAIKAARDVGLREDDIAVASVFTTRSATAVLEKMRDQIHAATPDPADFVLGLNGERAVFDIDEITGITWVDPAASTPPGGVDFSVILNSFPGALGSVAFGKFQSPDYEVHPGEYIPPVGTRSGTPVVQRVNDIYFNLYLPSGPKPASGWPVAIAGHGVGGSKNAPGTPVGAFTAHGIATIIINGVGNGFSALGTLTVNRTVGEPVTFSAGGRGIDQNGNGTIDNNEGQSASGPRKIVLYSDGFRQTAGDLMQLARVIEIGVDVDGDGQPDLDSSRMYYSGGSWGGGYGTVFLAVEPHVRTGVLTSPVDPIHVGVWGLAFRRIAGTILNSRQPSLLNAPGIRVFAGHTVPFPPFFDENQPLRGQIPYTVQLTDGTTRRIQSPVTNSVAGAMAIQEQFIENYEWVSQAGSPVAYAPHVRRAPLAGVPAKSVIYRVMKGDETAPNPTTIATVRAGQLADVTLFYRHDLARADNPTLPRNPHGGSFGDIAVYGAIAQAMLEQAATFFESDGTLDGDAVIHPEPSRYFEFPIPLPLPEGLNYLP